MEADIITEVVIDAAVECGSSQEQEDLAVDSVEEAAAEAVSADLAAEASAVVVQVGIGKYRGTREQRGG